MGAKKPDDIDSVLAARLGQEYRVVAERSLSDLNLGRHEQQQDTPVDVVENEDINMDIQAKDSDADDSSSVDGGVSVRHHQVD